jgi:hypothetical protein
MYAPPAAYGFVASFPPSACSDIPTRFGSITHSAPSMKLDHIQSIIAMGGVVFSARL